MCYLWRRKRMGFRYSCPGLPRVVVMTDRSDDIDRIVEVLLSFGSYIGAASYRSVAERIVSVRAGDNIYARTPEQAEAVGRFIEEGCDD